MTVTSLILAADPNPTPAPWRVITEFVFFAGMFGTLGVTLVYGIVIRPVLRRPTVDPADRAILRDASSVLLAAIGTLFLVALYTQIAGKAARVKGREIPFVDALNPSVIWHYVRLPAKPGEWMSAGTQTLAQYVVWAVAAALLMLLWAPRLRSGTGLLAWVVFVVTVIGYQITAVPRDFAKVTLDSVLDDTLTHLHIASNSAWIGGIVALTVLAGRHRHLTQHAGITWAQLWTRFSKVALTTVGCTLISGSWLAWKFVGSPRELFTTEFGHVLLIKITLVAVMILIGAVNEFVMMPRIARARAAGTSGSVFRLAVRVFPRLVALEVVLALGVMIAVTFLTGSARAQTNDDPDPIVSGGILAVGAVMAAILVISLIATAKLSDRLSRTAVAPQGTARATAEVDAPSTIT